MPDPTIVLDQSQPLLQRAAGRLSISVKPRGSETVLDNLRQDGCLRARFPRCQVPGWMDVVTLNTSGGIAGGDRLELHLNVAAGAQVGVANQAAERFYRRVVGGLPSVVRTAISVEAGASVEWLPQETILFDNFGLDRRLDISLSGDARFLGVETWIFGRVAMGETVRTGRLRDLIQVRRDGVRLLYDALRLDGDIDAILQRSAVAGGHRAAGTIIYVAPDAADRLAAVRDMLHSRQDGGFAPLQVSDKAVQAAASSWNGMLIARIVARDNAALRGMVTALLSCLRDDRPLPRVWSC